MRTLTLFNAYTATRDEIELLQIANDYCDDVTRRRVLQAKQDRRKARCERFARAICARLESDAEARIDRLFALADVQSVIINDKNDEIARLCRLVRDLEAALKYAQSHDYADDLMADCEAGLMLIDTQHRRRVTSVTIGRQYAFFDRNNDTNGDGYRMTDASRRRLMGVCNAHMAGDGWLNAYGVAVFKREVQP